MRTLNFPGRYQDQASDKAISWRVEGSRRAREARGGAIRSNATCDLVGKAVAPVGVARRRGCRPQAEQNRHVNDTPNLTICARHERAFEVRLPRRSSSSESLAGGSIMQQLPRRAADLACLATAELSPSVASRQYPGIAGAANEYSGGVPRRGREGIGHGLDRACAQPAQRHDLPRHCSSSSRCTG